MSNLIGQDSKQAMYKSVAEVWGLLNRRDRFILKLAIFLQGALSILDLFGVALIGAIGALSIYGIQSQNSESFATYFTNVLGIEGLIFQTQIFVLSSLAIFVLLTKTVLSLLITKKSLDFVSKRGALISGKLLNDLLHTSPQEINSYSRQELIFAVTTGVQYLTTGVIGLSISVLADFSLLVILGLGLIVFNPSLALTTLTIFISVGIALSLYYKNKAFKVGSAETIAHVNSSDVMNEVLSTFRESLVRDTRENYVEKFTNYRINVSGAEAKRTFMPFVSKYVMEIAIIVGAFFVAGVQYALFDAKTATAGLAVFFGASSRLAPSVLRIQQGLNQLRIFLGQSQSSRSLLFRSEFGNQTPANVQSDLSELTIQEGFNPHVLVSNLNYAYQGNETFQLRIDSLEVPSFSHVAIVGSSGSGKTTLIDLLLGVIEPSSGEVRISGVAPRGAFKLWPGYVGYVPQQITIASGNVSENVALGFKKQDINFARVKESLSLAGLEEFASEDANGLFLEVGEAGYRLSGGQRQRIGIARALYTSPRLLVLDEATSSLDSLTEFDITNSLSRIKQKMTMITIAHRLSTVKMADKVIFMENGQILASGSFDEVRAKVKTFDKQANLLGL